MMLNKLISLLLMLVAACGAVHAVEPPNPSVEIRLHDAQLVVVVNEIELLPKAANEFGKYYRVRARVVGVIKGRISIGERIEIVVDATVSELRNACCEQGHAYVLFLTSEGSKFSFVGSPLGAIPLDL